MYRNLFNTLQLHLPQKPFTIITGARQTGKSTLLHQLEDDVRKAGTPCLFINLENKQFLAELNDSPLRLVPYLPNQQERCVVFIDEIQYLDDPSNFLKLLYDDYADRIKIVAAGSSAFHLDRRFKDSLAGRKKLFHLRTCSFDEYLALAGKDDLLDEFKRIHPNSEARTAKLEFLRHEWETFAVYGGYPAVVTAKERNEKIDILREIRDSYVKRDISESGVQNEISFYQLFRVLASQCGNLLNVNELSSTLRIKNETVEQYLYVLQKCFHITLLRPYFQKLRKELVKMPKVYLNDIGMRNCLLNDFTPFSQRTDKGEVWETLYFNLLADRYDDVRYWRTADGNEVDFVMPTADIPFAVECKYDANLVKASKYRKFQETYPQLPLRFEYIEPFSELFLQKL